MGRQLTPRPPTLTLSPPNFHPADKRCSGKQCFRCCPARTSGSTSTFCSTSTPGSTSTSRRGGCAMGVAACGDQACSWSVVHSWQAIVAGPWPPVGGCALARPGMRTSPVSAARNLQTHWLSFCALAGAQGSLHGDQTWLGMLSRCATHLPQHQWSIGGISFAPWVGAQAL